jgi:hypothetical protein
MNTNPIRFELSQPNRTSKIDGLFDSSVFNLIKEKVLKIGLGEDDYHKYHTTLGRWDSPIEFDDDLEKKILNRAKEIVGRDDIQKSYYFIARYQKKNGVIPNLWPHMDQYACQITIDVCIEKNNLNWGLLVDDELFEENENSAICFYGQQQVHGRPIYPTENEDAYITLLFLHFVTPDHWFAQSKNEEELLNNFKKYALDGDVRYYLKTGTISKPDLPAGQDMCDCHSSYDTEAAIMKRINIKK